MGLAVLTRRDQEWEDTVSFLEASQKSQKQVIVVDLKLKGKCPSFFTCVAYNLKRTKELMPTQESAWGCLL